MADEMVTIIKCSAITQTMLYRLTTSHLFANSP